MVTRFDLVVFGATGYTGKNTIKYVDKMSKHKNRNYTWAVAGRSESKLISTLREIGEKIGRDLTETPTIIAEIDDQSSLDRMTKQSRLLVNTSGPFAKLGEPVIKACINNGTHYVDVSGEVYFNEAIQRKYHKEAEKKNVYIVNACGLGSIPNDLGVIYLQSIFAGTLNSVESYLTGMEVGGTRPGPILNSGTYQSVISDILAAQQLGNIRAKLKASKTQLNELKPKLMNKGLHKCAYDKKYALPFKASEERTVSRTQVYLQEKENLRPVPMTSYFSVESIFTILLLSIIHILVGLFAKFYFGRKLLQRYPRFFSMGYFSNEMPSDNKMENTKFTTTLIGEGWSTKQVGNTAFTTKPDAKMIVQISGINPGYGATCVMLTSSAMAILDDATKLPKRGGVYTPGAAFYKTSIITEMHENGVLFDIIS